MNFEELNVKPEIVKALKEMGITEPTPIQEKAIPIVKAGKDLIGMSKTGSGKTLAFGVPILEKIVPHQGIQILILSPVRELAVQIGQEMLKFGKYVHPRIATIYGGVSLGPQIDDMARAEIVVGTPGRTLDHLERGNLNLKKVKFIVLDEADKMVEMGFIEDVERIISAAPQHRQILLFGATISREIDHIKKKYMHNPEVAEAEALVGEAQLQQFYYDIQPHEKFSLLVHLLRKEKIGLAMIFCSTIHTVEIVTKNLRINGIKAEMIHGKLSQNKRLHIIQSFYDGKIPVLVASAVAARGLDIKDVTHIFNYDLSQDPQEYIHRIGRTARAGEAGKAITLLTNKDHDVFRQILSRFPVNIQELPKEPFQKIPFQARQDDRFGRDSYSRGGGDRREYSGSRSFGGRSSSGSRPAYGHSAPVRKSNSWRSR